MIFSLLSHAELKDPKLKSFVTLAVGSLHGISGSLKPKRTRGTLSTLFNCSEFITGVALVLCNK